MYSGIILNWLEFYGFDEMHVLLVVYRLHQADILLTAEDTSVLDVVSNFGKVKSSSLVISLVFVNL